jgi:thymidine kinase
MSSGKSEELIRGVEAGEIARQRVICSKPDIDLRYHKTTIASHSAQMHGALYCRQCRSAAGDPFADLMAIAGDVVKLAAVCIHGGAPAMHSDLAGVGN